MQTRISELEAQLKVKEQELDQQRSDQTDQVNEIQSQLHRAQQAVQEGALKLLNSERALDEKEKQVNAQQEHIQSLVSEIDDLRTAHNVELDQLQRDNEARYHELKQLY